MKFLINLYDVSFIFIILLTKKKNPQPPMI